MVVQGFPATHKLVLAEQLKSFSLDSPRLFSSLFLPAPTAYIFVFPSTFPSWAWICVWTWIILLPGRDVAKGKGMTWEKEQKVLKAVCSSLFQ